MDRDHELDQILERVSASALKSLDKDVDVDGSLRDLLREVDSTLPSTSEEEAP
ncbi:hypothetical protein [Winogradskya humida]|uniref:Uncharacterized protein n=1 Tax=Winogradskya humida TaxID=113566 RepID=A0ABQ3ZK92_9ACTN|nr:hypothetical protein [Actinoplanes humidus]GIE18999.1 hypothetical protein Ahu01nite_021010 [Actinoplanes humidus]